MRKNRAILLFLSIVIFTFTAFGQAVDAFYPFTVECPQEMVSGGETIVYAVKFPPQAKLNKYTFNWTITAGEIVAGQGTISIKVKLPEYAASSATAHVELVTKEPIFPGSQTTAQCTTAVAPLPLPILEDKLGNSWQCEEGLARLDAFFAALNNNPAAQGVIVFRIDGESYRKSFGRERQFRNSMKMQRFDSSRITFVRGAANAAENVGTEFWMVLPGAAMQEIPPFEFTGNNIKTSREARSEPFIFGVKTTDGIPECGADYYDLDEYADYLQLNQNDRANIVIRESSRTEFRREQKSIRAKLTASGIAAHRLNFFYVKIKPNLLENSVELWIVLPRLKD